MIIDHFSKYECYFLKLFLPSCPTPFAHGDVEAGEEELAQFAIGAESAERGDGADGHFGIGKQFQNPFETDMENLVKDAVSHRLAESHFEEVSGTAEARGQRGCGESIAGFAPDCLDCLDDVGFSAAAPAR